LKADFEDKQLYETTLEIISAISDILTIAASGIAIYIFIFKRHAISSAFRVLLNYSAQLTFMELQTKLERLNDLDANEPSDVDEVVNILNDILGQIRGSKLLSKHYAEIIQKISFIAEDKRRLSEPRKRALVSELRERLRNVGVENYADFAGE
jgi:hypothetical protein